MTIYLYRGYDTSIPHIHEVESIEEAVERMTPKGYFSVQICEEIPHNILKDMRYHLTTTCYYKNKQWISTDVQSTL